MEWLRCSTRSRTFWFDLSVVDQHGVEFVVHEGFRRPIARRLRWNTSILHFEAFGVSYGLRRSLYFHFSQSCHLLFVLSVTFSLSISPWRIFSPLLIFLYEFMNLDICYFDTCFREAIQVREQRTNHSSPTKNEGSTSISFFLFRLDWQKFMSRDD